jgi:hypothetical protein
MTFTQLVAAQVFSVFNGSSLCAVWGCYDDMVQISMQLADKDQLGSRSVSIANPLSTSSATSSMRSVVLVYAAAIDSSLHIACGR